MVPAWMVGVALLGAGMLPSAAPTVEAGEDVQGTLAFGRAVADGTVEVSTDDGALFALGNLRATLTAERLRVAVIEERSQDDVVRTGVPNDVMTDFHHRTTTSYDQQNLQLTNVALDITGASDGVLFAYGSPGGATYRTRIDGAPVEIESAAERLVLWEPSTKVRYQHVLESPLLGIQKASGPRAASGATADDRFRSSGDDGVVEGRVLPSIRSPDKFVFVRDFVPSLPAADLHALDVEGDVIILVHRSLLEATSDQGGFTWEAGHVQEHDLDAGAGGPGVERNRETDRYVVLAGFVRLSVDVRDASDGGIAGHHLTYRVDGRLDVAEAEGVIASHRVANATVQGVGRFVLQVTPDTPPGWVQEPVVSTPLGEVRTATAPPRPPVRSDAGIEGEASDLTANGRSLLRPEDPLVAVGSDASQAAGAIVLTWIAAQKLAAMLSPLYITNPLQHAGRRALFEAIQTRRMVHLRELRRMTGLPIGTIVYHVDVLRRFGLIATVRLPHQLIAFLPKASVSQGQMRDLAILAHPTRDRIGTLLASGGLFTQKDVAYRAKLSLAAASRQLGRMERAGLVERTRLRNGQYRASSLLRFWYAGQPSAVLTAAPTMADTG